MREIRSDYVFGSIDSDGSHVARVCGDERARDAARLVGSKPAPPMLTPT
jgi:hypothetical protein